MCSAIFADTKGDMESWGVNHLGVEGIILRNHRWGFVLCVAAAFAVSVLGCSKNDGSSVQTIKPETYADLEKARNPFFVKLDGALKSAPPKICEQVREKYAGGKLPSLLRCSFAKSKPGATCKAISILVDDSKLLKQKRQHLEKNSTAKLSAAVGGNVKPFLSSCYSVFDPKLGLKGALAVHQKNGSNLSRTFSICGDSRDRPGDSPIESCDRDDEEVPDSKTTPNLIFVEEPQWEQEEGTQMEVEVELDTGSSEEESDWTESVDNTL